MRKALPMLTCLEDNETNLVLTEVHEGMCGAIYGEKRQKIGYYESSIIDYFTKGQHRLRQQV